MEKGEHVHVSTTVCPMHWSYMDFGKLLIKDISILFSDMEAIKSGKLEIIYSHPEALCTAKISNILRLDV
jgi:hypothetical protein